MRSDSVIALTRDVMQTFQIEQCYLSTRIPDESSLLESMSHDRHTRSSYAEHLRQILLSKVNRVVPCEIPCPKEPTTKPRLDDVAGYAGG